MSTKLRDKFLPRELAALMEVKHPNAVRVFDIFKMSKKVSWMQSLEMNQLQIFLCIGVYLYGILFGWRFGRLPKEAQSIERGPSRLLVSVSFNSNPGIDNLIHVYPLF